HDRLFIGQDHRVLRYSTFGPEHLSPLDQDVVYWRKFAVRNARGYMKNEKSRNVPFPDEQGEINSLGEGMCRFEMNRFYPRADYPCPEKKLRHPVDRGLSLEERRHRDEQSQCRIWCLPRRLHLSQAGAPQVSLPAAPRQRLIASLRKAHPSITVARE